VFGLVSGVVDALESMFPTSSVPTLLSATTVVSAVAGGLSRGVANFLVPRDPLVNSGARCAAVRRSRGRGNRRLTGGPVVGAGGLTHSGN
jgi:hypothetical protein